MNQFHEWMITKRERTVESDKNMVVREYASNGETRLGQKGKSFLRKRRSAEL